MSSRRPTQIRLTAAAPTQHYSLIGVPAYLKLDETDNLLNPTRGYRAQLSVTPAHTFSGPNLTFVSNLVSGSTYWGLGDGPASDPRRQAGACLARWRAAVPTPGRSADLRRRRRIDPSLWLSAGWTARCGNKPIGGRSSLVLNLEARVKITETIGIVPFVDAGSYYESPVPQLGRTLLYGVGLGSSLLYGVRALAARSGNAAAQAQRRLADPGLYQPRPGLLMQHAGKVLRWLGIALGAVLLLLVAVFGLLQTQLGKAWLAREIARAASSPDFTVAISGLADSCRST